MVIARKNAACMKSKEAQLQQLCVAWFKLTYRSYSGLLFASANGGSRNVIEAANLKKQGVLPGVADLQLAVPNSYYHGLFIEVKIKPNKQQPSQIEFQNNVEKQGYCYMVIYDFEQFKKVINEYLCK